MDAKSLYDNLTTTGGVPKEKQVMIDLLSARELSEAGITSFKWVPTTHMVADILTKPMKLPPVAMKLLREGLLAWKPTEEEQKEEDRRAELRRGQRQRRKAKVKSRTPTTQNYL